MAPESLDSVAYDSERRVLLFADSEAALARTHRAAELAGATVAGAALLHDALDRLAAQVHADAIVLELEGEERDPARDRVLYPLLRELDRRAREHRFGSVVIAPPGLIDLVAALAPHRAVQHLCQPDESDRVAAVAVASVRRQPRLHDGKEDMHSALRQLSDEVSRIANALSALAEEDQGEGIAAEPGGASGKDGPPIDAAFVRSMIRARRLRDRYFKGGLFADPAWDMLLDLMAARLEKHRVAVSSLCIAAAVPPTTALRWIKTLTDRGILVRCADPADGRRVYIELSDEAARALTAYIRAAQRISPLGL